jgi:putative ABC transport system permease protein
MIDIGWEIFAISLAGALAVSLLTVSYHAIKASLINPAETLKHE